jgi:hypothetical protein
MSRNEKLYFLFLLVLIVFMSFNRHFYTVNVGHHVEREKQLLIELKKFQNRRDSVQNVNHAEEIAYEFENPDDKLSHEKQKISRIETRVTQRTRFKRDSTIGPKSIEKSERTKNTVAYKSKQYEAFEAYELVYKSIFGRDDVVENNEKINKFQLLRSKDFVEETFTASSVDVKLKKSDFKKLLGILERNVAFLIDLDLINSIRFTDPSVNLENDLPNSSPNSVEVFKKINEYFSQTEKDDQRAVALISFGISEFDHIIILDKVVFNLLYIINISLNLEVL